MVEKDLKKLKRAELLEMMVEQGKQNEALSAQVEELKKQLEDRQIHLNEAGSIAEASLQINGVFEAAQAAAQQYLENIRSLSERQEEVCEERTRETKARCEAMDRETKERCEQLDRETKARCEALESETKSRCEALESETKSRCEALESETTARCQKMDEDAKKGAQEHWNEISSRLESFYKEHQGLRELLGISEDSVAGTANPAGAEAMNPASAGKTADVEAADASDEKQGK